MTGALLRSSAGGAEAAIITAAIAMSPLRSITCAGRWWEGGEAARQAESHLQQSYKRWHQEGKQEKGGR